MEGIHYRVGDVVKVWSLQSFHGGGFLDGEPAIVRQNQIGNSVLLIVSRKPSRALINKEYNYSYVLDTSYEVYNQQIDLVEEATENRRRNVAKFIKLNDAIRTYEADMINLFNSNKKNPDEKRRYTSFNYAPEFYIDDCFKICLNSDIFQYPELVIKQPYLFDTF